MATILFIILALVAVVIILLTVIIALLLNSKFGKESDVSKEQILQKLGDYDKRLDKNELNIRNELETKFGQNRKDLTLTLGQIFDSLNSSSKANREELEKTRDIVQKKLTDIQESNEKKLELMRETVNEKLQNTLNARLSESFKMVSERLELVQKGLGEMQNLASSVGDLKKVMSNVKSRGVLGEYQLEAILEQMLNQNQYAKNVKTKEGSGKYVEFAIKIPSKEDSDRIIWLPIDAKFPISDYQVLVDAYEKGDKDEVTEAKKIFARTVKASAKEINDKYIDPPNTTDFAIMFLPFEGAYAEIVRDPVLFEDIRKEYKVIITGPSTIAAFLNALQVGFKSLAVEKGTGVILSTLGAVKKEFGNFETILVKVKEQIDKASSTLDETVGKRTRAINKVLKDVESKQDDSTGQKLITDATFELE